MGKRVLVFGTFDGIHPGHEFFLRAAKSRGDTLIVSVARDAHVQELKDRKPRSPEQKRLAEVVKLPFVDEARLSDELLGEFRILEVVAPELIVLGHDQTDLEAALIEWMSARDAYIPMIRVKKV